MAGGRGRRQRENTDRVELGELLEETSVRSPLRVRGGTQRHGHPSLPTLPGLGTPARGNGAAPASGTLRSDVIYCLGGVLQPACTGKSLSPAQGPRTGTVLELHAEAMTPSPVTQGGGTRHPRSGEEVAPSPPAGLAVGISKVLAPVKAFQ